MFPTRATTLLACGVVAGLGSLSAHAQLPYTQRPYTQSPYTQGSYASARALKLLSVEELMDIEVTSVSGTTERASSAAAAVTVVTNEDIRRSGATTIPAALRGVPGIYVGRRNSNSWAVSSRGFSSVNSEKLLVLSDTRSIYTPLVSGVLWDVQNYLLEDIDRIEVIRGPGATLWGSNAVNGVINITTKSAADTQGVYIEAGGGTEENGFAGMRYGGAIGEHGAFRVFGRYFDRDSTFQADTERSDDWRVGHGGFRADWNVGNDAALTLQGDVYRGNTGQFAPATSIQGRPEPTGDLSARVSGWNLLGRWERRLSDNADWRLRIYYDRTRRDDPTFSDELDTLDVDFQHRSTPWQRQEIVWGVNYRLTDNHNLSKGVFAVEPESSHDELFSAFAQDQISFNSALRLTIGTKLEHNDFSGLEVQPSVRLAWTAVPEHTAWSAISRAVRVPTRLERDIAIDVTDPAANPRIRLLGNRDFEAETLLAYELGYRWQPHRTLSADLALFHHSYDDLTSLEFGDPFVDGATGQVVVPIVNRNLTDGTSQGAELLVNFWASERWRLTASYSYTDMDLDPRGADLNRGEFIEDSTPRHQFSLRSYLDLPGGWQMDALFRRVGVLQRLPEIVTGEGIPGYCELDVRVAWRGEALEISAVGQNLLDRRHAEFGSPQARGEIERGVYGKIAWRF